MADVICPECGASFECTPEAVMLVLPSDSDAGSTDLHESLVFVS